VPLVLALGSPRRVFFFGGSVDDVDDDAAAATGEAAASVTEAVALLANKGVSREEEEQPSVLVSNAPALILLEVAVAAAALELAAGAADLLGAARRGKGKKACAVTTKRSRAVRPGRARGPGMFWEGLGADGQRLRGWKERAPGNEGSLLEIRVRVRVVEARGCDAEWLWGGGGGAETVAMSVLGYALNIKRPVGQMLRQPMHKKATTNKPHVEQ